MLPRVFIGSSSNSSEYAVAIQMALQRDAICTPWHMGAFELAESTLEGLLRNLHSSDFGIFVFAADDVTTIKGEVLHSPRDNVVFEAGMFTSYLGPERCFIATPMRSRIRIPSDLGGVTHGNFDETRDRDELVAAVAPFAAQVRQRLSQLGAFRGTNWDRLRELCAKFEFGELFDGSSANRRILDVASQIETHCRAVRFPKRRLLSEHQPGFYLGLLSLIESDPQNTDWALILAIQSKKLLPGHSYYKLMDALESLQAISAVPNDNRAALKKFLDGLSEPDTEIRSRRSVFYRTMGK